MAWMRGNPSGMLLRMGAMWVMHSPRCSAQWLVSTGHRPADAVEEGLLLLLASDDADEGGGWDVVGVVVCPVAA